MAGIIMKYDILLRKVG